MLNTALITIIISTDLCVSAYDQPMFCHVNPPLPADLKPYLTLTHASLSVILDKSYETLMRYVHKNVVLYKGMTVVSESLTKHCVC